MRKVIAALYLLAHPLFASAQSTFEKSYHYSNTEEVAFSATDDGSDGFVLAVGKKNGPVSFSYDFGLMHLNAIGDTLWYKKIPVFYNPEIKVVKRTSNGYAVMGIGVDNGSPQPAYFHWLRLFNNAGNSTGQFDFYNGIYGGMEDALDLTVLPNGKLFISTGYSTNFVVSVTGNILHEFSPAFFYPTLASDFEKEKPIRKDSTLCFLRNFSQTIPQLPYTLKVLKLNENADTTGAITMYLDSAIRDARILKLTNSSNFIIGGFSPYGVGNLFLSKTDSVGNKIWNKKVSGKTFTNCYLTSNAVLSNGNVVIGGFPRQGGVNATPQGKAFLYCFNENGDSLWYKELQGNSLIKTEIYDIIATSDTCILACGQLKMTNGTLRSYIVKMDANGAIFNPLSVSENKPENYFDLFPNPASTFLSLHYSGPEKNAVLSIINPQGQVIHTRQITNADSQLTINTSLFDAGFYLCRISSNGKILANKKWALIK